MAINNQPSGTDVVKAVLEDSTYTFATADFGFVDADGNALLAVKISTLPTAGTLYYDADGAGGGAATAVSAGQTISAADIAAGKLTFVPAANATADASFTFQVQDNGGTRAPTIDFDNGFQVYDDDLDATPNSFTFDITPVNDAPVGGSVTRGVYIGGDYIFSSTDFPFTDVENNALLEVKITTLPDVSAGILKLNGVAVSAGQSISASDIAAGNLVFACDPAASGSSGFTFQVRDDGGTANGGVDLDASPNSLGFVFNAPPPPGPPTPPSPPASLTDLEASVSFPQADVNGGSQILDSDVTISNLSDDLDGGTLTVSGVLAEDVVAIRNEGTGVGEVGISGPNVTYGNVVIGTFSGGNGAALVVTFDANATAAAVEAVIENLTYSNASGTPTAGRTLTLDVTDGSGYHLAPFAEQGGTDSPYWAVTSGAEKSPVVLDFDGSGSLSVVYGRADGTVDYAYYADSFFQIDGTLPYFDAVDVSSFGGFAAPALASLSIFSSVMDLVVGAADGSLHTYSYDVGAGGYVAAATDPLASFDVGTYATPTFFDFDGDGDMDLIVGSGDGALHTFTNDGNPFGASFTELTQGDAANPFGAITVSSNARPVFADIDLDGDMDLVVGAGDGTISAFRNDGGTYVQLTGSSNPFDGIDVGDNAAPAFADVDGDGDVDLVVGNSTDSAVLTYFENVQQTRTITVNITDISSDPAVAQDDAISTPENVIGTGSLFADNGSGADSDPDGPALTISEVNGSSASVGTEITLASGAKLTVNADGTYSYDPNGKFDSLPTAGSGASNTTASDSFTYTLTNGNTATVTVTINGVDTNDSLLGTGGADTLNGGIGVDTMTGGAGNDTYIVDNIMDKTVETAGGGTDLVNSTTTYKLGGNVENLTLLGSAIGGVGNSGANVITGNALANNLDGRGGADTLIGGAGNDTYIVDNALDVIQEIAGQGSDRIFAMADYTLAAGVSVESINASNRASTAPISLTGNELAQLITGNAGANVLSGGSGNDKLYGLDGGDTLNGDDGRDQLFGGAGSDVLNGGANNDHLFGGADADSLNGGGGNDLIDGEAGADSMAGGLGNDTFRVDNALDSVAETAGEGIDSVVATANYVLSAGTSIEILQTYGGSAASTDLDLTGNELAQAIYGNAGTNVLSGAGGNDDLFGYNGNDDLSGGTGNDIVRGGLGDDRVNGGDGRDQLWGHGGSDTFVFNSTPGVPNSDVIADFSVGEDTFELDHSVFGALTSFGQLSAAEFFAGTSAHDADDRIIYDAATGRIYYDADGNGVGAQVLFAQIDSGLAITNSDFLVVA